MLEKTTSSSLRLCSGPKTEPCVTPDLDCASFVLIAISAAIPQNIASIKNGLRERQRMMNPWQPRRLPPPHLPLSHFSVIANGERPILQVDRPSRLSSIILVDGTKDRLLSVMLMECGDGNRRGISE
jgi:hypothetical protein